MGYRLREPRSSPGARLTRWLTAADGTVLGAYERPPAGIVDLMERYRRRYAPSAAPVTPAA